MGSQTVSRRAVNPFSSSGTATTTCCLFVLLWGRPSSTGITVFLRFITTLLQAAASKRRAAYLYMDRARSTDHNLTGHGGGRLHAAFLPGRALCALCCCLIPGVSIAKKAVSFWFCFHGPLLSRANPSSLARTCMFSGGAKLNMFQTKSWHRFLSPNNIDYKVPLREVARGVAQERNEKHPA